MNTLAKVLRYIGIGITILGIPIAMLKASDLGTGIIVTGMAFIMLSHEAKP